MNRKLRSVTVLCLLMLSLLSEHTVLLAQCGVERWAIKTGTDAGATSIDLNSATPTTISALIGPSAPNPIPLDSRVQPTETTVWQVDATLTSFRMEGDSDYHLVISDASGNTMIAEIPSPSCVGSASPFGSAIAQARAKFDAAFSVSSSFQDVNVPVRLKGVGMFDFLHHQRGVAPNGIELHPVVDVILNPGADFSISASPASFSVPTGTTGNLHIFTSLSGTSSLTLSLSASGNPSGVNIVFASPSIAAGGSSNVAITVDPTASPGTFPLTITATSGNLSHSTSVSLTVPPASSPGFSISAAPQSMAVGPGGSNTASLSITPASGFNADISLLASGLSQGLTASFSQTTIPAPGAGSSALTVTADSSATPGTSVLTILGSGAGMTQSVTLNVSVCGGPATATQPVLGSAAFREGPGTLGRPSSRNEDDSQVQLLPSESTLASARLHGRSEVCRPLQYSIFLGSGWAEPSNRRRESALAHLNAGLSAPAICGSERRKAIRAQSLEFKGDLASMASLSDLQIQARLASMVRDGTLPPPKQETIFVVFLAPEVGSTLGTTVGGRDYLAFHNHFHDSQGEIRYIVVPFDVDPQKEIRTASRSLLRALVAPEGDL